MLKINIEEVQNIMREVARTSILPRFRNLQDGDIAYKGPDDPVTIADKEAEKVLSNHFLALLPGSKVVGEENFSTNRGVLESFFSESPVWIIDPIDGTRAFMQGRPHFGVIVALAERNQTVAGWLYDPTSEEFITVEKGAGAWHNGQRLHVLPSEPLESMRGALGHMLLKELKKGQPSGGQPQPVLGRMGYACHEYARLVVAGPHFARPKERIHFRASYAYCTPWDDAAGILAHAEAGGYAAHWNGDFFRPSHIERGLMAAPDKESWEAIKNWLQHTCQLNG